MITKTLWTLERKNTKAKCSSPHHRWVPVCSNIKYDMPSFHHFDYLWAPDISEHKNQVRCNMRNGKAWWVEAGADDQTLSLSGCPVTEVYSKGMCEKEDRIPQENLRCHSTWPNKGFLTPPTYGPMAENSEEHLELMIGKSPKRISGKKSPQLLHKRGTWWLISGRLSDSLKSTKHWQPNKFNDGFESSHGPPHCLQITIM